ncbi:hypothetical protein FA10DRAFT_302202 [Acaromyces ingoldii]|uniref:Glycosyltransferase family 24 protein n=1 Tax=Acaromyces ingoldii TaxID=215250 RepID=A0A316YPE5_9BASI|nr:hypothetical protein FA10DRAFT_302202 [Acaromyces ingoldii]PWN91022.1 hypothetical protein FA10DRAFT_302202 [Acaromyces ingoldii]
MFALTSVLLLLLRPLLPLLLLLLASAAGEARAQEASPPVHVSLRSGWPASPFVVELLEAAHQEAPSSFFDIVAIVAGPWFFNDTDDGTHDLASATPQQVFKGAKRAFDRYGVLPGEATRRRWEAALALRAQSSKVAAFTHLYRTSGLEQRWEEAMAARDSSDECRSWVDWDGKVLCSRDELQRHLDETGSTAVTKSPYPGPVAFDHVLAHPLDETDGEQEQEAATAVLYGDPASSNFFGLHAALSEYALGARAEVPFRYILRWRPPPQSSTGGAATKEEEEERDYLAGFGASLDVKKVDYLVIDDRAVAASGSEDGGGDSNDGDGSTATRRGAATEREAARAQLDDRRWLDAQLGGPPSDEAEEEEGGDAGLRAAYIVAKSSEPLRALRQLSHDFPLHAGALARSSAARPSRRFLDEMLGLHQMYLQQATTDVWLNGRSLSATSDEAGAASALTLLPLVRDERRLLDSLIALNLSAEAAVSLLTYAPLQQQQQQPQSQQQVHDAYFDASDRPEGGAVVSWWNDVEADEAYVRFQPELRGLLRPLYPGSFPTVRRNLFNVVLLMDLRRAETCRFLAESVSLATKRLALHWGFVPTGLVEPGDESSQLARLYWLAMERGGSTLAAEYLARLANAMQTHVTVAQARAQLQAVLLAAAHVDGSDEEEEAAAVEQAIEAALAPASEWTEREAKARRYAKRLGAVVADKDHRGDVFVNGRHVPFTAALIQHVHQLIAAQVQALAPLVYYGTLTDEADVSTHFYDLNTTFAARSPLAFPPPQASNISADAVDLTQVAAQLDDSTLLRRFFLPRQATTATTATTTPIDTTLWLVGDLDSDEGTSLLRETIKAQQALPQAFRLGLVHAAPSQSSLGTVSRAIYDQLQRDDGAASEALLEVLNSSVSRGDDNKNEEPARRFWRGQARLARLFGVAKSKSPFAIVINGRIVAGFDAAKVESIDVESLVAVERQRRIAPLVEGLQTPAIAQHDAALAELARDADAITTLTSIIARAGFVDAASEGLFARASTARSTAIDDVPTTNGLTSFELGADRAHARLRLTLMVDPLSKEAQRWADLVEHVLQLDDAIWVRVLLNPAGASRAGAATDEAEAAEAATTLRRFYRASSPARLAFDGDGQLRRPRASFYGMPADAVLTMAIEAPPAWVTMASVAVHDLDNIRLSDVARASAGTRAVVAATFDVKHVLIEGHARDTAARSVPRGLELVLETLDGSLVDDTIVMANLAYLQLRAPSPGLYTLRIRGAGSKSAELYEMESVGSAGWNSPPVGGGGGGGGESSSSDDVVTVDSPAGLTIYPRVRKRKGREHDRLVFDSEGEGEEAHAMGAGRSPAAAQGLVPFAWSLVADAARRIQTSFSAATATATSRRKAETINVFTVASGHLYERMASLMILSVLRHTQTPCKFWFIENFLSPSFKDFVPHLAREYGFEYEMVTYAWPHWLRAQSEKQRQIWGYKVLFLDVLFPLDVSRIIFVDADQIVRADLLELVQLDMGGKPYGFPPMGNDSYDMDNYRFWETGYWKKFLRGLPYPISALYVVDLDRFRLLAAGDRLRGHYQALSADKGSLSNLDQDLVASLIHQVPIYGLAREWLWCETWCSWDWQAQAKSIDLCSNPKTKEPKLDRARRQIPEWTAYDDEVARFAERVRAQQATQKTTQGTVQHDEL